MEKFLSNLKENGLQILICFAFVAITLIFNGFGNPAMYWLSIVFFGLGGLVLLFKPYLPTPQPQSSFTNHSMNVNTKTDWGIFNFSESHLFMIAGNTEVDIVYCWKDVKTLIGYISDEYIALQIYFSNYSHVLIYNFTPGWYAFHVELHKHFEEVSAEWFESADIQDTWMIILYDKEKRTREEIETQTFYDSFT